MKPLLVLLFVFLITIIIQKLFLKSINLYSSGRVAMSLMLLFTAVGHFIFCEGMSKMIPNPIPFKHSIVILTGILEIVFAIGLQTSSYKKTTGYLLILFFVLILPSNIKATIENLNYQTGTFNGKGISYLWFRIPLQFFFIAWVYYTTLKQKL